MWKNIQEAIKFLVQSKFWCSEVVWLKFLSDLYDAEMVVGVSGVDGT